MSDDLIIKAEPQKLNYSLMDSFPEKIELYNRKLDCAEEMVRLSLYNVGLRRFFRNFT